MKKYTKLQFSFGVILMGFILSTASILLIPNKVSAEDKCTATKIEFTPNSSNFSGTNALNSNTWYAQNKPFTVQITTEYCRGKTIKFSLMRQDTYSTDEELPLHKTATDFVTSMDIVVPYSEKFTIHLIAGEEGCFQTCELYGKTNVDSSIIRTKYNFLSYKCATGCWDKFFLASGINPTVDINPNPAVEHWWYKKNDPDATSTSKIYYGRFLNKQGCLDAVKLEVGADPAGCVEDGYPTIPDAQKTMAGTFKNFLLGSATGPMSWRGVGSPAAHKVVKGTVPNAIGNDVLVVFSGNGVDIEGAKNWATTLVNTKLKAKGIGTVYAVASPDTNAYIMDVTKIGTTEMKADIESQFISGRRLIIIDHSNGVYPAIEFLNSITANSFGPIKNENVTIYNLDGSTSIAPANYQNGYDVSSYGPGLGSDQTVYYSFNASKATSANKIELKLNTVGCTTPLPICLHMRLVNSEAKPANWTNVNAIYSETKDTNTQTEYITNQNLPGGVAIDVGGWGMAEPYDSDYTLLAPIGSLKQITKEKTITDYLNILFRLGIGICIALAVIMLIIQGVQYMGDESVFGKTEAIGKMKNTIGGLILVLGAWAILNTINPDLVKTTLNIRSITFDVAPNSFVPRNASDSAKCIPVTNPPAPSDACTVQKLSTTFKDKAEAMSKICNIESGGNPTAVSQGDFCSGDQKAFSFGLFQINMLANGKIIKDASGNSCADLFVSKDGTPIKPDGYWESSTQTYNCKLKPGNEVENRYQSCKATLLNPTENIKIAYALFSEKNGMNRAWGGGDNHQYGGDYKICSSAFQ